MQGLGFRVYGLGLEFRIRNLGFRDCSLDFRF